MPMRESVLAIVIVGFLVIAIVSVTSSTGFASDENARVTSEIGDAEAMLIMASESVRNASEAGANVTDLLTQLNVAGNHLSEAHVFLEKGDLSHAASEATLSYSLGFEAFNKSEELQTRAAGERSHQFRLAIATSSLTIILVLSFGIFFWRILTNDSFRSRLLRKIAHICIMKSELRLH